MKREEPVDDREATQLREMADAILEDPDSGNGFFFESFAPTVHALLDTREDLIEALTHAAAVAQWDHLHIARADEPVVPLGEAEPGDCVRCDVVRVVSPVLRQLRGEDA